MSYTLYHQCLFPSHVSSLGNRIGVCLLGSALFDESFDAWAKKNLHICIWVFFQAIILWGLNVGGHSLLTWIFITRPQSECIFSFSADCIETLHCSAIFVQTIYICEVKRFGPTWEDFYKEVLKKTRGIINHYIWKRLWHNLTALFIDDKVLSRSGKQRERIRILCLVKMMLWPKSPSSLRKETAIYICSQNMT